MITFIIGFLFIVIGACLLEFIALLFEWRQKRKEKQKKRKGEDHEREEDVWFDFIDIDSSTDGSDDPDRSIDYIPVRRDDRENRQKDRRI